ncbi:L-glyceraldehyde 3-phosphate reductase [Parelusimicrobium proximum]|uniref:aldo/keto reductase n=1 Tax=Parelusimicrobium proximum TaxID=3228953 RepID=UPI003D164AD9
MYLADEKRYSKDIYRRTGKSGLMLPMISLGLWHNFGANDNYENMVKLITTAFDNGITHFDLANNYGQPHGGSAEENLGKILKSELKNYRDEIIISTKAGYTMWAGPYGDWGSRKYILSSLDASLKRMGIGYVDIFYSHRHDPNTPLEETMGALATAVKSGKALYAGISNYNAEQMPKAYEILKSMGVPLLIHQPKYSMFVREPEKGLLKTLKEKGIGSIVYSPLAQGMLAGRYQDGIPQDSRVKTSGIFLKEEQILKANIEKVKKLSELAKSRGQNIAQLALAWVLRDEAVTSALIGASKAEQILDNLASLNNLNFTEEELNTIDKILAE